MVASVHRQVCHSKKIYATLASAERQAEAISWRRKDKADGKLTGYQCPWCGMFHIGHDQKRKR